MTTARVASLLLSGLLTAACNDPIAMVGPDNNPTLVDATDSFRYEAFDLQNVHDTLRWAWTNTGAVAAVTHESFLPHGDTVLSIRDADGVEVYNGPLESPQEEAIVRTSRPGRPGAWSIEARLYGVDGGRINFSVERAKDVVAADTTKVQ
jgi:hypothetical protein